MSNRFQGMRNGKGSRSSSSSSSSPARVSGSSIELRFSGGVRRGPSSLADRMMDGGETIVSVPMTDGAEVVIVALNRGDASKSVGMLPAKALKDEVSGEMVTGPSVTVRACPTREPACTCFGPNVLVSNESGPSSTSTSAPTPATGPLSKQLRSSSPSRQS